LWYCDLTRWLALLDPEGIRIYYPLAFGLPATVPSRGCGAAQCKVAF
jgi:hypothetical protein